MARVLPRYDNRGGDDGAAQPTYAETVTGEPASVRWRSAGQGAARTFGRQAWDGLRHVLAGPDPAPAWCARPAWERRAVYLLIGLVTLALCVINAATVHGVASAHGQLPAGCFVRVLVTGRTAIVCAPRISIGLLPSTLAQRPLAVVVVAPLLLTAWSPMLAWRIEWLTLLLAPLTPAAWWGGWPWGPSQMLALLAAFCLAGARQRRPELWWMWALTLVPWWLWLAARVRDLGGPVSATAVFAVVAIAVDSVTSRLRTQRALTLQTQQTHAERAQRAVLEERTRIARELHDVVAHHMSLVAVRAETAPYRLADLSGPARAEFAAVSDVAREALADMRRLLGVLRYDQPTALVPQPQLADLPTLVDAARRAGVSVELSAPDGLGTVPSGVALCAYRIVQESLSNASQHAPGASVSVSVDLDAASVVLEVVNGPAGAAGATGAAQPANGNRGPGHGLAGMRERVALLGGSLEAGPALDGGFVVSAVLPLAEIA
jgi:signal transduction histidine kinase